MQCKDIPDGPILELLNRNPGECHTWFDGAQENSIRPAFPGNCPEKLMLAKMGMMIRRGVVDGCACGCRGDFLITDKGRKELTMQRVSAQDRAPWPDYAGCHIHNGDTIRHPDGTVGRVIVVDGETLDEDRWRVDYGNEHLSRLVLQIGDKGQAVVVKTA